MLIYQMAKFSCESSLVVILVKAAIKTAKYLAILDPSKNKDIVALEKSENGGCVAPYEWVLWNGSNVSFPDENYYT